MFAYSVGKRHMANDIDHYWPATLRTTSVLETVPDNPT